MQLSNILSRIDDIESNQPTIKQYVVESAYASNEMTKHWRKLDEGFFKGYSKYLQEVALQPDQIQAIFKQTQASADAGGANSTMLGKFFDKVMPEKQAAAFADSLPPADAGPVEGFEQKAAASIDGLQADPQTKQGLMGMIKAGMAKPETQQLILAAVGGGLSGLIGKVGPLLNMIPGGGTAAAAITGAVIAGGVAVATAKLQGKDWKTAFKGAIKPALMGGAAAVIGQMAAGAMGNMASAAGNALSGDSASGDSKVIQSNDYTQRNPDGSPMTLDQINAVKDAQRAGNATDQSGPQSYSSPAPTGGNQAAFDKEWAQASGEMGLDPKTMNPPLQPSGVPAGATATDNAGSFVQNKTNPDGSSSQTVRQNADPADPRVMQSILDKQAYYKANPAEYAKIMNAGNPKSTFESTILPVAMIYKTLHRASLETIKMNEGVGSWLKTKAQNLTKSVTADKLQSAWKAAGSPNDSDALAKVLQDAGVSADTVNTVFGQLNIPAPGSVNTADILKQVTADIGKLDDESRKDITDYLTKSMGTAQ
jgi:hypothetical protein